MEQDKRKSVAKQLRDTVKWMAAETETWLRNLEERLKHLQRTTERMITEDECDELQLDAHAFLDQSDPSILVSERPERASIATNVAGQSSYMISRFFNEAALSGGPVDGVGRRGGGGMVLSHNSHQSRTLKSMQHFFLKWNLIHSTLKEWKARLAGQQVEDDEDEEEEEAWGTYAAIGGVGGSGTGGAGGGAGRRGHGAIDKTALGNALRTLDIEFSDQDLDRAFQSCRHGRNEGRFRPGGLLMGGPGTSTSSIDSHSVGKETLLPGAEVVEKTVTFEDVLTALPVWAIIMKAPAMEDSDLSQLQEAVDVIIEGYRLLTRHSSGACMRACLSSVQSLTNFSSPPLTRQLACMRACLSSIQSLTNFSFPSYHQSLTNLPPHTSNPTRNPTPGGRLGRAAWMIQKRETDMGEFASVIDSVFLERDAIDKETFFLVVARWAALRDDDGPSADEAPAASAVREPGYGMGDAHGGGGNAPGDMSIATDAGASSRMTDSYQRYDLGRADSGSLPSHTQYPRPRSLGGSLQGRLMGIGTGVRRSGFARDTFAGGQGGAGYAANGSGNQGTLGSGHGSSNALQQQALRMDRCNQAQRKGAWTRLLDRYRLWRLKKKLRVYVKQSAPAPTTAGGTALPVTMAAATAAMPDFERHFTRLDVDHTGWLDTYRAELLLTWGYDAELSREEWALLVDSLVDPAVGKVNLAAIERLWLELMGVSVRAPPNMDVSTRGGHSLDTSLRGGKPQGGVMAMLLGTGGSGGAGMSGGGLDASQRSGEKLGSLQGGQGGAARRLVGNVVVVEKTPWSERLLFDAKGSFVAAWDKVMTLNALYYFLSVPFIIAFLRDDILTTYASSLWVAYAFDCLLLCDVLIQLNTSFTDASCSVRVVDRQRIRHRYMTTGFLRDLVGILPLDIFVRFLGGSGALVACLRLPKLIFCYRLYTFFRRRSLSSSSRLVADLQALLFSALGMIHILACVWFFMTDGTMGNYLAVSSYEDYGDYTNHPEGGGPFRLEYYLFCFMVITTTISTQGLYDLVMGRVDEIVFTIFILLLNLSAWAYLMGTISGLCVTADESIARSHELMTAVSRFIQHNPMPPGVSEELKTYFNVNAQQKTQLSLAEQNEIYRCVVGLAVCVLGGVRWMDGMIRDGLTPPTHTPRHPRQQLQEPAPLAAGGGGAAHLAGLAALGGHLRQDLRLLSRLHLHAPRHGGESGAWQLGGKDGWDGTCVL